MEGVREGEWERQRVTDYEREREKRGGEGKRVGERDTQRKRAI